MTSRYMWNKSWRQRFPKKRVQGTLRYYARHRDTPENKVNTYQRWTLAELDLITAPDRPCDVILAKKLGRSLKALQIKRSRVRPKS